MNVNLYNDLKKELSEKKELGIDSINLNDIFDRFYLYQENHIITALEELAYVDRLIFLNIKGQYVYISKKFLIKNN